MYDTYRSYDVVFLYLSSSLSVFLSVSLMHPYTICMIHIGHTMLSLEEHRIMQSLDRLNAKLKGVWTTFYRLNAKLKGVWTTFYRLNAKLKGVWTTFYRLNAKLKGVWTTFYRLNAKLKGVWTTF